MMTLSALMMNEAVQSAFTPRPLASLPPERCPVKLASMTAVEEPTSAVMADTLVEKSDVMISLASLAGSLRMTNYGKIRLDGALVGSSLGWVAQQEKSVALTQMKMSEMGTQSRLLKSADPMVLVADPAATQCRMQPRLTLQPRTPMKRLQTSII